MSSVANLYSNSFAVYTNTTSINDSTDTIFINNANTYLSANDLIKYIVPDGSSAISGLESNNAYFVTFSNSSAIALSVTKNGPNVSISPTEENDTNYIYKFSNTNSLTLSPDGTISFAVFDSANDLNVSYTSTKLKISSDSEDPLTVSNSSSEILVVKANGSVLVSKGIVANNSLGTTGQILYTNGTGVYWGSISNASFSVNVDNPYVWTNTHTFTNTVTFNQTIIGTANSANYIGSLPAANVVSNAQLAANLANYVNTSQLASNLSVYVNTAQLSGNLSVYVNTAQLSGNLSVYVNTSQLSSNLANYVSALQLSTNLVNYVNTSQFSSNLANYVNTAQLSSNLANYINTSSNYTITGVHNHVANVSVNGAIIANGSAGSSDQVLTSSAGGNVYWKTITGTGTVTSVNSGNGLFGGPITTSGTLYVLSNTGIISNSSGLFVNATYIGTLSANNASFLNGVAAASYVNTSGTYTISGVHNHVANVSVNGAIIAGGSPGTSGQVLTSNGTGNVYWSSVTGGGGGTVTSVATANGIGGGPITTTGTVYIVPNTGIIANSSGVFVDSTYIGTLTANNTIHFNGLDSSNYLRTTGNFNISGVHTHTANTIFTANVTVNASIVASGSVGSAGQVLTSNGASNVYWSSVGTVTSVSGSNGIGGSVSSSGSLYAIANTGIVANASGLFVNSAYINSIIDSLKLDSVISTSISLIPVANTVKNAYDRAIDANTRAASAQSAAISAYSNAVSYTDTRILTVNSAITSNAATAYSNAVSYVDGKISTANSAITGNAATAYSNAVSYVDGKIATANSAITGNAATAYSNAVSYVDGKILTANSAITGNAATAYSNSVAYTDSKISTANSAITGNAATAYSNAVSYVDGLKLDSVTNTSITLIPVANTVKNAYDRAIDANTRAASAQSAAISAYSNAVSYVDGKISTANSAITGNAATAYSNAVSFASNASNLTTGTLPYARIPANIINTTSNFTISGVYTYNANIILGSSGFSANGSFGTAGQTLHSNGSATYWSADDTGITSITAGTGLSGGTITSTGTISMPNVGPGVGSYSSGISAISLDAQGRVTAVTGSAGYATTSQLSSYLPLSGGTLTGRVIQSASGFGVATDDTINSRIDSGFWQTSNAQTSTGWPESTASWYHLITSTHGNDANYFSMQFAGSFFDTNALYYRATNNSGTAAWNKIWHAGNDGAASGLDADLLDAQHGSYYLNVDNMNAGTLGIGRGGTGVTSLTTNGVLFGGTTIGATALGASGTVLTGTGAAPAFSASPTLTSLNTSYLRGARTLNASYDVSNILLETPTGIEVDTGKFIRFTNGIAPFSLYRTTGDQPAPYGIGWGNGQESSGIFQRFATNGVSFGEMIFYTGNDGSGSFAFRRATWESTAYNPSGSNHYGTLLASIDMSGYVSASRFVDIDNSAYYADPAGTSILNTISYTLLSAQNVNTRDKVRVWNSASYTIGMTAPFTFGAIDNDYAMTFQMNNASTRGFWWGDEAHTNAQGAMALSTDGKLTVAHSIRVGYGESDVTVPGAAHRLDVSGSTSLSNVTISGITTFNANVILGSSGLSSNGSFGTAGQVLHSNGTATYWSTDDAGVTSVGTGNGLTGGTITTTGTISVLANNGITANSAGLFVTQGTGTVVNATGVHVNSAYINTISSNLANYIIANTGLVSNATGVYVNATYIATLSANNSTYLNGQLASYYTNASNITTGTLPYAQIPVNVVNTTAAFTRSGVTTFSANVVLGSSGLSSNGSFGTAKQVLSSNGSATYWANSVGSITMQALTITTLNTFPALTYSYSGQMFMLIVNGMCFTPTGSPAPFSVSGTTITWASSSFSVYPGDSVTAIYSY